MPKSAKPLPPLTDEQKATIEAHWTDAPDVLFAKVWPGREADLRTIEWKAVRVYLATIGKDPGRPGSGPQPKDTPSKEGAVRAASDGSARLAALTSAQEEFIAASYKDASGPVEVARTLFQDERIMPGDQRVRLVMAYIRSIDPSYRREDEPVEELDYQPPRTPQVLIGRLNRYGIGQRPDGRKLGDGGLSPQEHKQVDALLAQMRKSVFKVEADKFSKKIDRDVFEEVFLSTCWDKPDLSAEHALQYIQLASLSAQRNMADRMVRMLDERFMVGLEDPQQRLSKSEVDALKELKDKASEHLKQINTLIKTLTVERKQLIAKQREGSASMHPLVEAWKNEEDRKRIIALVQKKQQAALKQEVERFGTMDSLKAELWGIDPQTIVY